MRLETADTLLTQLAAQHPELQPPPAPPESSSEETARLVDRLLELTLHDSGSDLKKAAFLFAIFTSAHHSLTDNWSEAQTSLEDAQQAIPEFQGSSQE